MSFSNTFRRSLTATATCASIAIAALLSAPAATASTLPDDAQQNDQASRFTLGILPDTQFYSRYATEETGDLFHARYGSDPFETQTAWLAEHSDELNMPFVSHLGDVVDQAYVPAEWPVADTAMQNLENSNLPYSILPGNHDLTSDGSVPYLDTFSTSRAEQQPTFGDRSPDELSEYHVFEAEGQQFLVLALEYHADNVTLDWASEVLNEHAELPAILTAHEYVGLSEDRTEVTDTEYGQHLWDYLIADHDQIFLTLSGHNHGAGYRIQQNNAGNDVVEILMDYQMAYQGGNGLMGLLEFDLTNDELQLAAFSPWVGIKPFETLTSFDDLLLADEPDSWTLDFNFAERFAGFNTEFTEGTADELPLADRAMELVSADFAPYEPEESDLPTNREDYPELDTTAAHWRPGELDQQDGSVIETGAIIPEVTAQQHFTRQEGINGAEEADVTFTNTAHPMSADGAAVCFANADKHFGGSDVSRLNYFTTDDDAAINTETFDEGYTAETFIRVSEDWTAQLNPSMKAFARMGQRENITEGGGLGTPLSLAFSNLQELQWSAMSNQQTSTSNWSHEVPKAEWVHVAVVNDPADQTITMYVDGAPILRNVLNVTGIAHDDGQPWMLGAGQWGEELTDGWNGCIGETRLVTEPLEDDQWLTARSTDEAPGTGDDATDEPTAEPTEEPTPAPTEEPTDGETEPTEPPTEATTESPEPTNEPSQSPSDTVAVDDNTHDDDLARTGAGVLWLIAAGVAAIILGAVAMVLRRRNAS